MIGRILFLSAAAFLAYRYIRRSDQKVQEIIARETGTVEILGPEKPATTAVSVASESGGSAARTAPLLSAAAEDLGRR